MRLRNDGKIKCEGSKTEKYAFVALLNNLTFDLSHLQIDYCKSNFMLQTELTVHTGILLSIQQKKPIRGALRQITDETEQNSHQSFR